MTILVTGARGAVGRSVLTGLIDAGVPAAELRASGRDPSQLTVPAGVSTVAVDLGDPASLLAALDGVGQVFLYAPPGDAEPMAAALAKADAGHVVLLSAAAIDEPAGGALAATHLAVENAVTGSGVTVTALRPGTFASNTLDWAAEIRDTGTVSLPYPDSHFAPIHPDDIADVAVAVLTGRAPHGIPILLTGPQSLTIRDEVAILAWETGRDIRLAELTPEQARARMVAHMPPAIADTLLALAAAANGVPRTIHDVEPITGRAGRTFGQWVRENRDAFADLRQ
jgi:uncharacterized protein YbjT (DUF2867 family)